jgi:hypothetical protein
MVAHLVESVSDHRQHHAYKFFGSGGAGPTFVVGQFVAQQRLRQ